MSIKQLLLSTAAVTALVLGNAAYPGDAVVAEDLAKEKAYEAAAEAEAKKVAGDEAKEAAGAEHSKNALEAAAFAESEEKSDVAEEAASPAVEPPGSAK